MNTPQFQNDKLKIINWITQLEDAALVEKIKSLMKESGKPYLLTNEQQKILDTQVNSNKSLYTDAEVLFADLKKNNGL
jgi:hypothetical protein